MTALPKHEDNIVQFNKGKKMADKFEKGYVMSSQLYRKEVYPFLSDAARHVYFELENKINGFQKDSDFVSYSQLQGNPELEGARTVSRMTVAKGIKELANHGVITILATHPKLGNKYQINEVSLLGKQYTKSTSTPTVPVHVVDQSSTRTVPQVVHVVDTQKKDLKIFIKDTHTIENPPKNSVDEVLSLWIPDLHSLNSWLQRSGEKTMTQDEVNLLLPEVNAHYEGRIKSGVATNTKMYANFVKWVKSDYNKYKKQNNDSGVKQGAQAKPKQQREQAWADYYAKRNQQQPNNIIDVIEVQHD